MGQNNLKKQFGAAVRFRRDYLGISQEELAGRAGLHRTYISDVERGARNVSLESIQRLAEGLKVPLSVLFSRLEDSSPAAPTGQILAANELVDILIVEDSVSDAGLAIKILNDMRLTNHVFVVRDGTTALDFLFFRGEFANRRRSDRPQIILLNLNVPKVDGLEILRQIKGDSQTRSVPVIALAGVDDKRALTMAQQLGAEAHIVKPMDFHKFSMVIKQLSLRWALLKKEPSV